MDRWRGLTTGPEPDSQSQRMEEYWKRASNQFMNSEQGVCIRIACNTEKSASAWVAAIPHRQVRIGPNFF